MPAQILNNPGYVIGLNQAILGSAPSNAVFQAQLDQANASNARTFAINYVNTLGDTNAVLAAKVLTNLGIANATLQTALEQAFAAFQTARGAVVYRLIELLQNLEGDVTFGAAAATYNNAVTSNFAYAADPNSLVARPTALNTVTLTSNTDNVTGSIFSAGLVFTPGGDDRVNSLQDEDTLNGTGANARVDAILGNANDNGGVVISPNLNNISTVNVSFSGAGATAVNELDLQDATGANLTSPSNFAAININRINDGIATATVDNIGNAVANLSVSRSGQVGQNVDFEFTAAALAGGNDSTTVTLSQVALARLSVQERQQVNNQGFETITLTSNGADTNRIGVFRAEDLATLRITGGTNLTLGGSVSVNGAQGIEASRSTAGLAQVAGSLTVIDGSAATGALDITLGAELNAPLDNTSGTPVQLRVTTGSGNDTIRIAQGAVIDAAAGNVDTIDGGMGTNTLVLLGGAAQAVNAAGTAAAPVATVLNVQNLEIRSGHDTASAADVVTVNADAFNALATIFVRNEGNTGAGNAAPIVDNTSASEAATVTLNNLTATQANGITVAHGTTGNNGMADLTVLANLKVATGATDTVGVTITNGVNANPRFNFAVTTNDPGIGNVNRVENFSIRDNDTESNVVRLNSFASHIGTITLSGGQAGTFLNLDANTAANGGAVGFLQRVQTGVAPAAAANETLGRVVDVGNLATQVRLVAATIDATAETSDVELRVSSNAASPVGAQTISMGSGNDTVIFDNLNDNRAGLTISDTVVGGLGADTLVIDGNLTLPGVIALGASEWTNVSGFESIRLVNAGAGSTYSLSLTDNLITNNNTGGIINIVNDNDANNDASRTTVQAAAAVGGNDAHNAGQNGAESAVVIDATALNATSRFNYNGEEGTSLTNDRFIFSDVNINGGTIIDGGAIDNINDNRGTANVAAGIPGNGIIANQGNADILEIRNAAVVSAGDLANIRNVGNIEFTNQLAVTQASVLQLNDQIVDAMVDSYQTSTARSANPGSNVEVLNIRAFDNPNLAGATTGLTIEAGALTSRSDLNIQLGRGVNVVTTGTGQDAITVLGNFTAAEKAAFAAVANGVSQVNLRSMANETINVGGGVDTVTFVGGVNLVDINANTLLADIEVTNVASNITLTDAQYRALTTNANQSFNVIGAGTHTVTIVDDGINNGGIDLNKFNANGLTVTLTIANTLTVSGTPVMGDNVTGATINGTANADNLVGTNLGEAINGRAQNDVITANGGKDTINGGNGADTINLAETTPLTDVVIANIGDSVARTASTFANAASIANGDTLTFGNGVDVVNGYQPGVTATSDRIDVQINTIPVSLLGQNSANLDDNTLFTARGSLAGNVFTFAAAGADTIVVQNNAVAAQDSLLTNTSITILVGVSNTAAGDFF